MGKSRLWSPGRVSATGIRVLKSVYGGALRSGEVSEATGLSLSEVVKIAKTLVATGMLCAMDGEDWCIRDETREIPEMARIRGLP